MRRRLIPLALAGALVLPASAQAAPPGSYFPGSPIDAPGDLRTAGDLDLAPDGSGAVAYVKRESGEDRLYVARFSGGVFRAPERLDASLGGDSAQPSVAADDDGRLIVAFVNRGVLHVVSRRAGATGYEAPRALAGGASTPAADLGVNGTGSVVWTQPGASAADVRAARQERDGSWVGFNSPLDVEPGREAGAGTGRPRVAVAADGVATAVWGEAGRVFARKLFRGSHSAAQDLTVDRPGDPPGQGADLPDVDVEFDSSFAWVTFRQRVSDGVGGRSRLVARRMRGTAFDDAVAVDGLQQGGLGGATDPRVDLNGRGVGLLTGATDNGGQVLGTPIFRDQPRTTSGLSPATGAPPLAVPALSANNDGLVAWYQGGTVQARTYETTPGQEPQPRAPVTLSGGQGGAVDPQKGLDASVDRAFGAVVVWGEGPPGAQTLMYGVHDRAPGPFAGRTTTRWSSLSELTWREPFELWGATYQVFVDGRPLGTPVTQPRLALSPPPPDGPHLWAVVASDVRGQTSTTPTRRLLVDNTPPQLRVAVAGSRRAGQRLAIRVRAQEPGRAGQASGLSAVHVSPGSGAPRRSSRAARGKAFKTKRFTVRHAYARGARTLKVTAHDRAGNVAVERIRLRIR